MTTHAPVTGAPVPASRVPKRALRRPAPLSAWIVLGVGLLFWALSLILINTDDLGPWGLLPHLTVFWYLGLVLVAGVCLFGVARRGQTHDGLLVAALAVLTFIMYGTTTIIENAPRLAWTYKHVGVTRYLLDHGTVTSSIDIYQRWPGAFAFGGFLTSAFGITDPSEFAGYAQLFYALVLGVLVFALATSFSANRRAAWAAVLVFTVANWTGQLYYAPQPLALIMHLGTLLLIVRFFRSRPNNLGRWVQRRLGRQSAPSDVMPLPSSGLAGKGAVLACILLMHLASTISHQLTPFVTIGTVLLLLILGYVRSWPLVLGLLVITGAYVIPNFTFLQENYPLVSNLNPFANFRSIPQAATPELGVKVIQGWLSVALTLLVGLLALWGVLFRWRRGGAAPAVLCGALIASPLFIGLVQNYGGEARFRAFMFALPWCAVAIGWLVASFIDRARGNKPPVIVGAVFAVVLALFVPTYFGAEDLYYIPRTEVQACQWLSTNSPADAVYVMSVSGFPSRCASNYHQHIGPTGDTPNLVDTNDRLAFNTFQTNVPTSMNDVYQKVLTYGPDSRLIFSTSQERFARGYGLFGGAAGYERLEQAVATSRHFTLVYSNADTRIYALVP